MQPSSYTMVIGTPGYMPDEQAKGHPKLASDIYAVGMIAIQSLTGILPHQLQFSPQTLEINWQHLVKVSDSFATVLTKIVKVNFNQRYPSAKEALEDMKNLINSIPKNVNSPNLNNSKNPPNLHDLFQFVPAPQKSIQS